MTGGPGDRGTVNSSRPNRAVVRGTGGCCIDWRKSFCDFDRRGYLQATMTVGIHDASRYLQATDAAPALLPLPNSHQPYQEIGKANEHTTNRSYNGVI